MDPRLVAGRFEIVEEVASGGMGTVFRARDRIGGASVALKILKAGCSFERFTREASVLATIEHPAVVRYLAHGSDGPDGREYLVTEWLEGETLAARLRRGAPGLGESLAICAAVADALGHLARGEVASKVPIINGNASEEEEFSFGLGFLPPITDDAGYVDLMAMLFGDDADAILAYYPSASYASPHAAAVQALTDAWDICPGRAQLGYLVAAGLPVYAYDFQHAPASPAFPEGGAFHTAEVGFVFGTPQWCWSLGADELPLSATLMGYWGRFVATADPNGAGALTWPAYDPGEQRIVFDLTLFTMAHWRRDACAFWDSLAN